MQFKAIVVALFASIAVAMPADNAGQVAADAAQHCSDVPNPDRRERCREQRSSCRQNLQDARQCDGIAASYGAPVTGAAPAYGAAPVYGAPPAPVYPSYNPWNAASTFGEAEGDW